MKTAQKSLSRRLVLIFWVFVLIFYAYLSYDYLRVQMTDDKFADALQHIVQIAGTENRTYKEIRSLVLVRADELSVPVRVEQIAITGSGHTLSITVRYDVDIDIIKQGVYTKHFEHKVTYQQSY